MTGVERYPDPAVALDRSRNLAGALARESVFYSLHKRPRSAWPALRACSLTPQKCYRLKHVRTRMRLLRQRLGLL